MYNKKLCDSMIKRIIDVIFEKKLILAYIMLGVIGYICNIFSPFPSYSFYGIVFLIILLVVIHAEQYFFKEVDSMLRSIGGDDACRAAKYNLFVRTASKYNVVIPASCAILFTILGLSIYSTKKISAALIIMLLMFSIDIFFCMIGHLQYIYIFEFVYRIKKNAKKIKKFNDIYPSKTDWVIKLAMICKNYQYVFFTLGSLYIIAFAYLCANPLFGVNVSINNTILIIEWSIIFILIVLAFPIVTFAEYKLINSTVETLKENSVKVLSIESNHLNTENKIYISTLIINIIDSRTQPINNTLSTIYSALSSVINTVTASIAILNLCGISNQAIFEFIF